MHASGEMIYSLDISVTSL